MVDAFFAIGAVLVKQALGTNTVGHLVRVAVAAAGAVPIAETAGYALLFEAQGANGAIRAGQAGHTGKRFMAVSARTIGLLQAGHTGSTIALATRSGGGAMGIIAAVDTEVGRNITIAGRAVSIVGAVGYALVVLTMPSGWAVGI